MRVLIIEDEALIAKDLQKKLTSLQPTWEVVAVCESVQKTLDWLQKNAPPALAFMDIQLADGTSFEIFEQIQIDFPVIFTTAYEQYALQAFQVSGIAYLLKPVDEVDLQKAIDKFQKISPAIAPQDLQLQIKKILKEQNPYKVRFLATYKGALVPLVVQDIACIEKDELIFLHTFEGKKYLSDYQTMDEIEQVLNPAHFYRANRQFILNIDAIDTLKPTYKGLSVKLRLPAFAEIEVSREKVTTLKQWLNR